jgi:hypothetical protein
VHPGNPSSSAAVLPAGAPTQGCQLEIREPQIQSQPQQQIFEAAVAQAAREQQQILQAYELAAREQQQILQARELAVREQHELLRAYNELLLQSKAVSFNGGFDPTVAGGSNQLFEAQQLAAKKEQQGILRACELAIREKQEILRTYELAIREKQEILRTYELAIREKQEILRAYELLLQSKPLSFNGGFDPAAVGGSSQHHEIEPQQWEHHGYPLQTQLQQLQQQDQQTRQPQSESEMGKGKGVAD